MNKPIIDRVIVDPSLDDRSLPSEIASKIDVNLEVKSKPDLIEEMNGLPDTELFSAAKKILYFTENKGSFLKKCPGSRGVVCCNYYTINSVSGCPYDCSYCILQHYIKNNPFISVFNNRQKAIEEMIEYVKKSGFLRVGTGELADSLALDHLLNESGFFLTSIAENNLLRNNVQFEFKTKSAEVSRYVEVLEKYGDKINVVTGFSVNINQFQNDEELGTASIFERIEAAKKLMKLGSKIAIHFDPIVMIDDFFEDYKSLINEIFSSIDSKKIAWISMGGFRHTLSLTQTIRQRFPNSSLLIGEMFPSDKDNKLRYLSPIRKRFYDMFIEQISKYFNGKPPLYMCMEKSFMWNKVNMNIADLSKNSLKDIF